MPLANAWSGPANGLSGRLRVEFEDLEPGLRHAVHLELRSHLQDPVAVPVPPRIHARLFDPAGRPLGAAGIARSGPVPEPRWAVIPRDAYVGFRIDLQSVGVPARGQGVALLAVGGESWELGAGRYVLKVAVASENQGETPPGRWVGELELPPVEVVVTARMLAGS